MIERDYNLYILVCDICGEEQTYNDFQEAVEAKKKEGWQSKREKEQWMDICPECQTKP